MPRGGLELADVLKGTYRVRTAGPGNATIQIPASGRIPERTCADEIQAILTCSIAADVPSAASYNELRREALAGKRCKPAASRSSGADASDASQMTRDQLTLLGTSNMTHSGHRSIVMRGGMH